MGDLKTDKLSGSNDPAAESRLRGGPLSRDERRVEVDGTAAQKSEDTDQLLRTDDEEDTLYEDGLELENDSRPLKGINGRDDT
jgi:hypothetical protein